MRFAVLFVIALALGALVAATILNASARRNAWPRGVMEVMQHHAGALRESLRAGTCNVTRDKAALALLADEIEPSAYAGATPDPPFREYTQRLRDAIAELPAASNCSALAPVVTKLGNACDACHRQYR